MSAVLRALGYRVESREHVLASGGVPWAAAKPDGDGMDFWILPDPVAEALINARGYHYTHNIEPRRCILTWGPMRIRMRATDAVIAKFKAMGR